MFSSWQTGNTVNGSPNDTSSHLRRMHRCRGLAEGNWCPFLHLVGPALIEPKGIRHRVGAGKGGRAGSMRPDISQARTENPTWSIIPDVSPGTSS